MNELRTSHSVGKLILGIAVVALGLIFTLSNLNLIDSDRYLRFWPVVLIAFGLEKLLQPRASSGRMFGFILAAVGVLLLLRNLAMITWNIWDLWPLILVLIGFSIVWGALGRRSGRERFRCRPDVSVSFDDDAKRRQVDPESTLNISAVFGGDERVVTSQGFRGGTVSTIMGGCDIDLRQASIAQGEAILDVSVVFGGVEIRVPEDWKVVLRVNSILGGVEEKTRKPIGDAAKTLVITGSVIFGGVEIRN